MNRIAKIRSSSLEDANSRSMNIHMIFNKYTMDGLRASQPYLYKMSSQEREFQINQKLYSKYISYVIKITDDNSIQYQ